MVGILAKAADLLDAKDLIMVIGDGSETSEDAGEKVDADASEETKTEG